MTSTRSLVANSPRLSWAKSPDAPVSGATFILWRDSDRRFLLVAAVLAMLLGVAVSVLWVAFGTARVNGMSMEPTLQDRDLVLITRGYETPANGDVVAATVPDERGRPVGVLKRVIALPGDTVDAHGDVVSVNGVPVPPLEGEPVAYGRPLRPVLVPPGHVYLLGDRRFRSYDSRVLGPVPGTSIRGEVVAIILPFSRFSIID